MTNSRESQILKKKRARRTTLLLWILYWVIGLFMYPTLYRDIPRGVHELCFIIGTLAFLSFFTFVQTFYGMSIRLLIMAIVLYFWPHLSRYAPWDYIIVASAMVLYISYYYWNYLEKQEHHTKTSSESTKPN